MKRCSVVACTVILAALAVTGQALAASDDDAALRAVVQTVADGWNRADGEAVAAVFTADGTLLTGEGDVLEGHGEIARHLNRLFETWFKETRLLLNVTQVRRPSPDIAVVRCEGGVLQPGEDEPAPGYRNVQTFVVVKNGVRGASYCSRMRRFRSHKGKPYVV